MSEEMMNEVTEATETEALDADTTIEDTESAEAEAPDINSQFLESFKITYDGEETGYESIDDLISDAQKGKNYSRVLEQRDALKNDPAYQYIQEYMKNSGYTDPAKFVHDIRVNTKMQELIKDGMPQNKAREYAEQLAGANSTYDAKGKEIEAFVKWQNKEFPGEMLDTDNIPEEVIEAYREGTPLKEAYLLNQLKNSKFKTEQETLKKIKENSDKSAGKVPEGKSADNDKMTPAQINKILDGMSAKSQSEWLDKNWKAVEKSGYFG